MDALVSMYNRDLDKLISEIGAFKNEENLWSVRGGIANGAGNLCLHLVGNLNHFIGAIIGNSGFVRDRASEFSDSNVASTKLIDSVLKTKEIVADTLKTLGSDQLNAIYPLKVFGDEMTYEYFLLHLLTHLNYHIGQINYLRRILEP